MSGPATSTVYKEQLAEAERLFDEGRMDECVAQAHKNLDELDITPEYVIKNFLLLACAVEGADERKECVYMAEAVYADALWEARQNFDGRMLQTLAILRKGINQVEEWRLSDISGMTQEEKNEAGWDEDTSSESDEELDLEDAEAATEAENEMEAASQLDFDDEATTKAENDTEVTANTLDLKDAKDVAKAEDEAQVTAAHIHIPFRTKVQNPGDPVTERAMKTAMDTATADISTVDETYDFLQSVAHYFPENERHRYKSTISEWKAILERAAIEENERFRLFQSAITKLGRAAGPRYPFLIDKLARTTLADWQEVEAAVDSPFTEKEIMSFAQRLGKEGLLSYNPDDGLFIYQGPQNTNE